MIDYLVDDNFDIVLPLQKVKNQSDLLFQQVRLLLETWQGDFPYDSRMGIGYEQKLINRQDVDVTDIELEYYKKISKLQYFKKLDRFTIQITAQREVQISFDVYSIENKYKTFEQVA